MSSDQIDIDAFFNDSVLLSDYGLGPFDAVQLAEELGKVVIIGSYKTNDSHSVNFGAYPNGKVAQVDITAIKPKEGLYDIGAAWVKLCKAKETSDGVTFRVEKESSTSAKGGAA